MTSNEIEDFKISTLDPLLKGFHTLLFEEESIKIHLQARYKQNGDAITRASFFKNFNGLNDDTADYSIKKLFAHFQQIRLNMIHTNNADWNEKTNYFVLCTNRKFSADVEGFFVDADKEEIFNYMFKIPWDDVEVGYYMLNPVCFEEIRNEILNDRDQETLDAFDEFRLKFRFIKTCEQTLIDETFAPLFDNFSVRMVRDDGQQLEVNTNVIWNSFQFLIWRWYGARNHSIMNAERISQFFRGEYEDVDPVEHVDGYESDDFDDTF